ncbi:hypothetical protein [Qipengyuania sp. JC766]|uniref:hypothetical protein n=1 Tax=Qipengyuania sp. JC766 TaxID=3232139 RepID=UPI003458CC8C
MARRGFGYFDRRGRYFRTAKEATISDLAAVFGHGGDGESLAEGIALTIMARRTEIEEIFREYDAMQDEGEDHPRVTELGKAGLKVVE